ncbi:MAG: hypothetical protein ACI4SF_05115 [Oscillospiraceae bacterium]
MKVRKRLSKVIAGITAVLLALTPLPFEEMGIYGNGVVMTASAEESNGDESNGDESNGDESNGDESNSGETNDGESNGGESNDGETYGGETNDGESNGDEPNDDEPDEGEIWLNLASLDLPDNDELFEGFVNRTFYGNISLYADQGSGYRSLTTAAEKEIYDLLKPELTKIANGERESTEIAVTPTNTWEVTSESFHRIIWALLTDFPYDVYWFDKTTSMYLRYSTVVGVTSYIFPFPVAAAYAGSSDFTVNTTLTGAASAAAANAQTIVSNYETASDIDKLNGYRTTICDLVEYNNAALAAGTPYGDPWQLIYVFDNDPSTDVVCEGYSKAFQYLCDLTEFSNSSIECALVSGDMVCNGSGGGHMWNIVSIDDVSYVVDVTNCDSGSIGADDLLFLKGMTNISANGFTAALSYNVVYTYDADTKATFDSAFLTVSDEDYDPNGNVLDPNAAVNLTDNNGTIKNYSSLESAINYISNKGSSSKEYTITLNQDAELSALTLPAATKAASITFDGDGALKLNMTSLNIPTNVTFDVTVEGTNAAALAISVAAGKTLTINGEGSRNIGKISGTATSVLDIKQNLTVGGIATFGNVNVADGKAVSVEGNVTAVTHFNGALWLKDSSYNATITNIGTAEIVLYDIDGANAKVTISNIDEDGSLNVKLVDSLFNEITVASGRTILWAGSTVDFTSKVTIENKTSTSQDLNAYLYGKEIKAEYGEAVTLSVDGDSRKYPNLVLAFNDITDAAKDYTVTLNENVSVATLTFPTKAKSITLTGGKTLTIANTALTLPIDVTFKNITLETTNASGLTITASKNLTVNGLTSASLKAVNGAANSVLEYPDGGDYITYSISGFGTIALPSFVVFDTDGETATTVSATNLVLGTDELSVSIIVGNCNAKFTNVKSGCPDFNSGIRYADAENIKPVTITGTVTAENPIIISAVNNKFSSGDTVLIAQTADLSKFKLYENSLPDDGIEYILEREGSEVKVRGAVYQLSDGVSAPVKYSTWAKVVAAMNSSTKDYTVELLTDVTEGNITFPAATKAKSVSVVGDGHTLTIANSTLTLPTDVVFAINLETTNANGLTITASKNLTVNGLTSTTLKTVKGSSNSVLTFSEGFDVPYSISGFGTVVVTYTVSFNMNGDTATTVSATNLVLGTDYSVGMIVGNCNAAFINVTAKGASRIRYTDAENFKPVTITGKVTAENPIIISASSNKFSNGDTVLVAKTADLSKFTLDENSLPEDEFDYALAREGSNVKVKCAAYELSSAGSEPVKFVYWSDVVAAMNDKSKDYTVTLLTDTSEGNITFPAATKAKSVTVDGVGHTLTIANTTLTLPTDVNFYSTYLESSNAKKILTITASKNLHGDLLASSTSITVKGSSNSVLELPGEGFDVPYSISGFGTVVVTYIVSFNMNGDTATTVSATNLVLGTDYSVGMIVGNCNATFANVTAKGTSKIRYTDAENFKPVTITGKVTADEPIVISAESGTFKYGDTVLIAKTAELSKFTLDENSLPDDGIEYILAREGSNVKVKGAVFELSSDGSAPVKYASWADAVSAMNDKDKDYTITLLSDVTEGNITFPAATKAKSVTLTGGKTLTIANTALTLPTEVIFGDIKLETTNTKGLTITASKNLTIKKLTSTTLKTVNGNSKLVLQLFDDSMEIIPVTYGISGFGTVDVKGTYELAGTVKATKLVLEDYSSILVGNNAVTFTSIEAGIVTCIVYNTADFTPVTVNGSVTAEDPITVGLNINNTLEKFAEGDTVFISKTADISKFDIKSTCLPESTLGYTLARVGSNVKVMGVKFKLSYGTTEANFAQWSDILNTIAENAKLGNKTAQYTVSLLADADIGGALTMPKAGTFGSLTIQGEGTAKILTFTGATLSLTGKTEFNNLILKSAKTVNGTTTYVDFSFNAGKNELDLINVTGKIKDVRSTGTVTLGGLTVNGNVNAYTLKIVDGTEPSEPISAGGIKAMNSFAGIAPAATSVRIVGNLTVTDILDLNYSLTVKGSFSAAGINSAANSENVALVLYKNEKKPAVIGKKGFDSNSNQIKFALVDPSTGLTAQIIEDTVIATISGKYADNLIPCDDNLDPDEREEGYYIVKENGKLIAKPKNAPQGFVMVTCNGKTAYYTSLDAAIKDINATGISSDEYIVYLTSEMFSTAISKLPLPNAGKYGKFTYEGSAMGSVTINVTSDITLTGDLVLNQVYINKVDKNGNVLPISVNVGKYTLTVNAGLSREDGADQIANISGTGKFIANYVQDTNTIVTGRVNVGTFGFKYNTVTLKGATASFTGSVSVDTEGTLEYDKANAKNVKFNNISGNAPLTVKIDGVEAGDTIAAITGDYTKGAIKIDGSDLLVVRSGGYLKAFNASDAITVISNSDSVTRVYDTLENAMTDINRLNNKDAEYEVDVTNANGKTYSKLPLPAANKYKSIWFVGTATINVSSDITLTGDLYIEDAITINKVDKNGKVVEMSVNVGNYEFLCGGKLSYDTTNSVSQLKNVSGKGEFSISGDATVSGKVNVGIFAFSGTITLGEKAAFAGNIKLGVGARTLKYPVAVGKNVKLGTIIDGYAGGNTPGTLYVQIDGVKAGDQIATLSGDYIAGTVVIGDGSEFTAVRSGTKLLAVANEKAVTVSDGTNTRAYDTYANAIADITRLNNKNGNYSIVLPAGTYTLASLTLPAMGKYASIEIAASGAANIEVKSDVTLTGNLVIGTNVTLKKVKIFGGDAVSPFKFTSAKNKDGSPVYTVITYYGTIVNGTLNGEKIGFCMSWSDSRGFALAKGEMNFKAADVEAGGTICVRFDKSYTGKELIISYGSNNVHNQVSTGTVYFTLNQDAAYWIAETGFTLSGSSDLTVVEVTYVR